MTTAHLLRQRIGVMGASHLIEDMQLPATTDSQHAAHVGDVEIDAEQDGFCLQLIPLAGHHMFCPVEAVIDLAGGERNKLPLQVSQQQGRVVVGLQPLDEVGRQVWVVGSAHLDEAPISPAGSLLRGEGLPHPPVTLRRGGSTELAHVAGTEAAENLGEGLSGNAGCHGVNLISQHPCKVQADDAGPVLKGPAQDLGVTTR